MLASYNQIYHQKVDKLSFLSLQFQYLKWHTVSVFPGPPAGIVYRAPSGESGKIVKTWVAKSTFLGFLVCLGNKLENHFHGYNKVFLKFKYIDLPVLSNIYTHSKSNLKVGNKNV